MRQGDITSVLDVVVVALRRYQDRHTVVKAAASVASSGDRHAGDANDTADTSATPASRSRKESITATAGIGVSFIQHASSNAAP
jgi:hypothetical protein